MLSVEQLISGLKGKRIFWANKDRDDVLWDGPIPRTVLNTEGEAATFLNVGRVTPNGAFLRESRNEDIKTFRFDLEDPKVKSSAWVAGYERLKVELSQDRYALWYSGPGLAAGSLRLVREYSDFADLDDYSQVFPHVFDARAVSDIEGMNALEPESVRLISPGAVVAVAFNIRLWSKWNRADAASEAVLGAESKTKKGKGKAPAAKATKTHIGARFQLLQVWLLEDADGAEASGRDAVVASPTKRLCI